MKTCDEQMEQLLDSFRRYYTVKSPSCAPQFAAEAEFHSHTERYFLTKEAHIADIDSNEYVFFAKEGQLTKEKLSRLDESAWQTGLARVKLYSGHRNTDVSLLVVCEAADEDARKQAGKLRHYKSYRFGFLGWSGYRLLVYENATGTVTTNRLGANLRSVVSKLGS